MSEFLEGFRERGPEATGITLDAGNDMMPVSVRVNVMSEYLWVCLEVERKLKYCFFIGAPILRLRANENTGLDN